MDIVHYQAKEADKVLTLVHGEVFAKVQSCLRTEPKEWFILFH